jgi:hypothetical protein
MLSNFDDGVVQLFHTHPPRPSHPHFIISLTVPHCTPYPIRNTGRSALPIISWEATFSAVLSIAGHHQSILDNHRAQEDWDGVFALPRVWSVQFITAQASPATTTSKVLICFRSPPSPSRFAPTNKSYPMADLAGGSEPRKLF